MSRFAISMLLVFTLVLLVCGGPVLAAGEVTHEGKITKIDKDHVTIQSADAKKSETVVAVDSHTKIKLDGKEVKLSDLKTGFKAKTTCKKDGAKVMAVSIDAHKV